MNSARAALHGILAVDKPADCTSAAVVRALSALAGGAKAGHLGTLDPLATGLLVVCFGNALKLVPYFQKGRKRYVAELTFGLETDTWDIAGRVTARAEVPATLHRRLPRVLARFVGTFPQLPPMYSAVKVEGRRLYELARRGEEVERSSRTVTIHRLLVVSKRRDAVVLDVTCSAGTYIRSLAHDIGAGLGCPAVVSSLRRLESQPFTLDAAASYEGLLAGRLRLEEHVRPLEECLPPLPCRALTLAEQVAVMHGSAFAAADCPPGPLLLLSPGGKLLAVGEGVPEQQVIRVKRVITTD